MAPFARDMPRSGTAAAAIAFYCAGWEYEVEADVEKVLLLCLVIAFICVLAAIAPAAQPRR